MATLESLKERHDAATSADYAGRIRHKARALAARLGTPIPEWAAPRQSLEPVTLEYLKARHDSAKTPIVAASRRAEARALASRLGIPCPEWAAQRQPHGPLIPWRRRAPQVVATRVVRAVTLDELLSEWRRSGVGRIVRVHQDGVELHELGQPVRRFKSTNAAIDALTAP